MSGGDATPQIDRDELFADRSLVGTAFCRAYARRVDEWLSALFPSEAVAKGRIALVAVGGYGRSTLSPQSDLDVMLLHRGWAENDLREIAEAVWFPVWDAHISLGHSVRSLDQSLELAKSDLDTATSLLSIRHLVGDERLCADLADLAQRQWRRQRRQWLPQLVAGFGDRAGTNGEVAFLLEPDLKISSGGLRDINALRWMNAAGIPILDQERRSLRMARDTLLAARVELHRSTGRKGDVLFLDEQDAVAAALAKPDADMMMSEISSAARTVTWIAENATDRTRRRLRRFRFGADRPITIDAELATYDGVIGFRQAAPVSTDPALLVRLALRAAMNRQRIRRDALDALVEHGPTIPTPWPDELRRDFVELLLTGADAIPVIETLAHVGLFERLLPEWAPNRSKVQRNPYHRFTVDRHLLEASAEACELVDSVDRPDLLVVGALLHDIGKGYPGDHTDVGVELIGRIGASMGFCDDDVDTLARLCEHHLLLPDAATRRDIEDPDTIAAVAAAVETPEFLHLLAALTRADSIATGPSAWSSWKAHLIAELTRLTERWLTTDGHQPSDAGFPGPELLELMHDHDRYAHGDGDTLTVIGKDRPGLFARVAGAVALSNLNIVGADTHVADGKVLDVIRVVEADDDEAPIAWPPVVALVEEIMAKSDDLRPRFEAKVNSRLGRKIVAPVPVEPVRVDFDNDISSTSTVIEVAGPDRLGLLYELSTVLAEAGLDQQQTRVQTVGGDVVDAFYVQTLDGAKVTDPNQQRALAADLKAVLEP